MAQVGSMVARTLGGIFRADSGLPFAVGLIVAKERLSPEQLPPARIEERNISADTLEKQVGALYPSMQVFCERLENRLKEKFRTFSGLARMAIEIRVTKDHIDQLEDQMRLYVDAATQVLDMNRGDWGGGMFYSGGYEVEFRAIGHGGKNYRQTAKISFTVDVSVN